MRKILVALGAVSVALAIVGDALAAAPTTPAAITDQAAGVAAPFAPPPGVLGAASSGAGAMWLACKTTPALTSALNADPSANVQSMCAKYGKALSPALRHKIVGTVREGVWKAHTPSLCLNAGCAYIWLWNEGGGWGYMETEAMPYPQYGHITSGWAYLARYTESNGSISNWSDQVDENYNPGWRGYRYLYPIKGTSNSWVNVAMTGSTGLSSGYTAGIGPVNTWNYITH
jgi:hypothetical protein